MITHKCPHCQAGIRGEDRFAGRVVACPKCKKQVQMPAAPEPNVGANSGVQSPCPPPAPPLQQGSVSQSNEQAVSVQSSHADDVMENVNQPVLAEQTAKKWKDIQLVALLMSPAGKAISAIVCISAFASLCFFLFGHNRPEPQFDGKPLSYWVVQSKDKSPEFRKAAARALVQIGPGTKGEGKPGIDALARMLSDTDKDVQAAAANALERAGKAESRIPTLTALLRDKHYHYRVRDFAFDALRKMGSEAVLAIPALIELVR